MTAAEGRVVLDSSALLAVIKGERGGRVVAEQLARGIASSIIWAETIAVCYRYGLSDQVPRSLRLRGLQVEPLSSAQAELAAGIQFHVGRLGLSLADCSCIALGIDISAPVYTADAAWEGIDQGVDIRLIR